MHNSPYELFNNQYGVRLSYIVSDVDKRHAESVALFSYSAYKLRSHRNEGFRIKEGRGLGNEALINFSKLPLQEQNVLVEKWGDPAKTTKHHQFKDFIIPDAEALNFFSGYRLADGRSLPKEVILNYTMHASILNACHTITTNNSAKRKTMGGVKVNMWEKLANCVLNLDKKEFAHALPPNYRRLQEKFRKYKKEGYTALIHRGFCNDNSRKVTVDVERLILSLYIAQNKPYVGDVSNDYLRFLAGDIDIFDFETGEIFDRNQFCENGQPITLSEATVWNYINEPGNRIVVDKFRSDSLTFNSIHRPHHHRHAPNYSFSKISMDDRDLPRKMPNGNRVKAYYAYDITSGCVIGAAYSQTKDKVLFIDCMRNMFHFLDRNGYGMPMQVEVEHHLVNTFKDDLMQAGVVFPFVRWCNPGNSQEKWAETGNRVKKYGYEKRYQDGIGRFYSRLEANKTKSEKIFDAQNDNYKEKRYSYQVLVADDKEIIEKYNNDLHPNQKKYKDLTRAQVLVMYTNPELAQIDRALLLRYIGNVAATSIRRSQYVQVQYAKYALPDPKMMERLAPNNYEVKAYYLPNELGETESVYLYQNDLFICKCDKIKAYNSANAEWNEEDPLSYSQQASYVSQFDRMVKQRKASLSKLKIIENTNYYAEEEVEAVAETAMQPNKLFDWPDEYAHEDYNRLDAINAL
ncbi:hypothetical protein [Pedobacter jeongneungensis]|uniref:hypothetical protein n=1 Tax=Pedobacter jeongneungensis TaxID=947309 RepID=UPI000468ABB6|nr:hypothetical protein [Pedobacter jeongneungensis]